MSNRSAIKLISVLLGIFAWTYVNIIVPSQVRRTISTKIEYRNMPELMKVTPEEPRVEVELEGNRRDFILSGPEKLQASVDLYNLRPGKAILPVKVTSATGLSVKSINPPQIRVEARALTRKEFPVEVKLLGQPADGYMADKPRITPEKVVLEGAKSVIRRVEACQIEVSLVQLRNSISDSFPVKVIVDAGGENSDIKVIPEEVNVDVTVKRGYPEKEVPISKPAFLNKLPEGKKLSGFKIIPKTIKITGPVRLLEQIKELSFSPVDLSEIHESASLTQNLELPFDRVELVGSSACILNLQLTDVKVTRVLKGLSFNLVKTENQHTGVSVSSYSMKVKGYLKELKKIKAADLKIVLNISEMKPGVYDVPLSVPAGLPAGVEVVDINPDEVEIEISLLEKHEDEIKEANQNSQPEDADKDSSNSLPDGREQ
ncbi:MAG: CdaR family protein [Candidatus Rifleibacteriota bacterium]